MSSGAALVPPTNHSYKTQPWQERDSSDFELQPQGLIARLLISCSETLRLLVRCLDSTQITKGERNSLKRCHKLLLLWSEGHGATTGALDASLDSCKSLRLTTLAVLNSMCKLLAQGVNSYVLRRQWGNAAELIHSTAIKLHCQTKCLLEDIDQTDSDQLSESSSSSDDDATDEIRDLVHRTKLYINSLLDLSSALICPALEPNTDDGVRIVRFEQRQVQLNPADDTLTSKTPLGRSDNVSDSSIRSAKDPEIGPQYAYKIKCTCGAPEDEDDTVLCTTCNTWQHIKCYYTSVENVPDEHRCSNCSHTAAKTPWRSTARPRSSASEASKSSAHSTQPVEDSDGSLNSTATASASAALPTDQVIDATNKNAPCNTLYVRDLPMHTSEDELKALFSAHEGYKRLCFRTKQHVIMCFVEFEDTTFATQAMERLQGQKLEHSQSERMQLSYSKTPLGVVSIPRGRYCRPQASVQSSSTTASFTTYRSYFAGDATLAVATWVPNSSAFVQERARSYRGRPAAVVVHNGGGSCKDTSTSSNAGSEDSPYFK